MRLVCGDDVDVRMIADETDWLIESQRPRRSELARIDSKGRREVLAANLDRVFVVVAAAPAPDLFIVDRFLGAAQLMGCEGSIVLNKSDLQPSLSRMFSGYEALGYDVLETSARTCQGVDRLEREIGLQTVVLVGQSGVGKTSLMNAIVPAAELRTGRLDRTGKAGRHTTVAAQLLRLPRGGGLIDSPGVRDFAPYIDNEREVAFAYREIAAAAENCRFADCRHRAEPDCRVKEAVETGSIDARRYTSYRRLLNLTRQLRQKGDKTAG